MRIDLVESDIVGEVRYHLHLEYMRATIRRALSSGAARAAVAREMGVPHAHVRSFLMGRHLEEVDAERMRRWCQGRSSEKLYPEQVALAYLASDLPQHVRPWFRWLAARLVRRVYLRRQDRVPEWVRAEAAGWERMLGRGR